MMAVAGERKAGFAYCPRCRRVVAVASGRRAKCPECGRVLAAPKDDVITKGA